MNGINVPPSVLMHWYVCGRKMVCATETIAYLYAPDKHAYKCPYADHWHVGRRPVRAFRNHDQRKTQLVNARKAWDQQAYKAIKALKFCEFDPPCGETAIEEVVYLNPRMPIRRACESHADQIIGGDVA